MGTNKKILVIIFIMLSILSVSTIVNVGLNFIDFGKKATIDKAHSIAESVRDGLTAHMVLGKMDKRDLFLHNMKKHQNVKTLRVIRSKSTIAEFGNGGLDSYKYDDIEKSVLKNAKPITKVLENDNGEFLRITIPYIASKYSKPNCLRCHVNEKEGSVLGAISLELDISEIKRTTMNMIIKIILISLLFLILAFFITKHYIKPYIKLFDDLEEGISKAYKGDFSYQVSTKLSNEAGKVAKRLNDLSEIFRFKKTIELDSDKQNIYSRLAYILQNNFGLQSFLIFENDKNTKRRKIAYKSKHMSFIDEKKLEGSKKVCRAFRTNTQVNSTDFHKICELCYIKEKETVCLPFDISDDISITLLIYVDDVETLNRINGYIPIIKNYFELAEPVLETKILMDKLHEKSLKDPMTGLYNRRFLDNYIETNLTDNSDITVMMLDIDFFKQVNDTYGHDVGDEVIKTLSEVLRNNIKGSDLAIRYGGEEFLIIAFNISMEVALKIAEHIRVEFSKKVFKSNIDTFSKTISIGVSKCELPKSTPWRTIKYADVALYYAKEHGRNKVVEFKPEMYHEDLI